MAGQSEMAVAKEESQRKTTKTKKKRTATSKKSTTGATRKKSASSRRTKQADSGGLPIMKLRAIDIVDGSGTKAAGPDKAKDQDNEEPQVIHMPPPAADGPDAADESREATEQPVSSTVAENEDHANENQVSDPELLELLEQLSVTIDTANEVLDAAVNVPQETSHSHAQMPSDAPPSATDTTIQMQQSQSPEPQFNRLADRLSGINQEKDDLRPLAERFASTPNAAETGRAKRGKFRLIANAALTGAIVAAGVGWLAYTNPWILEGGSSDAPVSAPTVTPEPEQAATVTPQQTAAAEPEAAKDQTQLGDERPPLPEPEAAPAAKPETESLTPAVVPKPEAPKPALSALTPPEDDPVPMESVAKEPVKPAVLKPVRGTAGDKIALNIALPSDAGSAEMSIMVQSVPAQTELSAGKDLGSGNWLLTTGQLDGLTLNTKDNLQPGEYQVEVIMVRSDGKVPDARKVAVLVEAPKPAAPAPAAVQPAPVKPAPKKEIVEPKPADAATTAAVSKPEAPVAAEPKPAAPAPAAPDTAQPTLPPLSKKQVSNILKRGDALLQEGDVSGARLLLGYAAARGHTEAMERLAKSYDPEHLAKLGVRGVEPDPAKAAHWYERARKTATAQ